MTTNPHPQEVFGRCSGVPSYILPINRADTGDSGYLTDLTRQNLPIEQFQTVQSSQTTTHSSPRQHSHCSPPIPADQKFRRSFTSPSKHSRKNKIHKCTMCAVDKRFSTKNDLQRHIKTLHARLQKGDKVWFCPVADCSTAGKPWPRLDNFCQHVLKQHGPWDKQELADAYEIVTEDSFNRDPSWSPKSSKVQVQIKSSPSSNIDPSLCGAASETTSNHNAIPTMYRSPSVTITRHSPTTSMRSAARKLQSYVFRPALTSSAITTENDTDHPSSQSPKFLTSQRLLSPIPQTADPCDTTYPPLDSLFEQYVTPDAVSECSQQFPSTTEALDSQDSFINFLDGYMRDNSLVPGGELVGIGSFDTNVPPSLSNTSSTLTSVDQLDGIQQSMQSCTLPSTDFQLLHDHRSGLVPKARHSVPQVKITPSLSSRTHFQSLDLSSCCSRPLNPSNRLHPQHPYSPAITSEPDWSPGSDGVRSSGSFDTSQDADMDLDSATDTFIDALVALALELYKDQLKSSSGHTTRAGTADTQGSSSPNQQRQTTNDGNRLKRKASHPPGGRKDRSNKDEEEEDDEEQDDQNPSGNLDNKRVCKTPRGSDWACPYHKNSPLKHRQCATVVLKSISIVKQHLNRKHSRPRFYCKRCGEKFKSSQEEENHSRQKSVCELRECQFGDKMAQEISDLLHKRSDDSEEAWNGIYKALFPGQRLPQSPFIDDQISVEHIVNILSLLQPDHFRMLRSQGHRIPQDSQLVFRHAVLRLSENLPGPNTNNQPTQGYPQTPDSMSRSQNMLFQPFQGQVPAPSVYSGHSMMHPNQQASMYNGGDVATAAVMDIYSDPQHQQRQLLMGVLPLYQQHQTQQIPSSLGLDQEYAQQPHGGHTDIENLPEWIQGFQSQVRPTQGFTGMHGFPPGFPPNRSL